MQYAISIMNPDLSIAKTTVSLHYEAKRGCGYGFQKYFDKNPTAIRSAYGLQESNPLVICITLKIPISVFSHAPTASPPNIPPKWMTDLLAEIQNPEKSIFWSAKLISSDGDEFYCHKVIAFQSEPLRAMFRHPPADGNPENEYKFDLASDSLKALVHFLYTGQADLANLTTTDLIELADAAEMYDLKPLKEACSVVLWKEVVDNPKSCGEILRFADLHDDLKDLKYRAMDVLVENFAPFCSVGIFGSGDRGEHLRVLFHHFSSVRVEPKLDG